MVSSLEMYECAGKHIDLYFKDGRVWENKFCTNYYQAEDDDEEPMLEFGNTIINQSQIEKIEILD